MALRWDFSWLLIGRGDVMTGSDSKPEVMCFWNGKPLTSMKIGSWAHATGSDVFWKGKPLTSMKIGLWAHGTGSHVI